MTIDILSDRPFGLMSLRIFSDQEQDELLHPSEKAEPTPAQREQFDRLSREGMRTSVEFFRSVHPNANRQTPPRPQTPLDPEAAQSALVQRVVQLTQQVSRLTTERDHLRTRIRTLTSLLEGYQHEEEQDRVSVSNRS